MVTTINLHQLSGTSGIELFLCGICESLAVDPLIHDGGYNQNFCQRFYCRACLPTRIGNPMFKRVNRQGRQETHCLHYPHCLVDFNHPYFRKPSPLERQKYNKIIIKCNFCTRNYTVANYLTHIIDCTRGILIDLPAGSIIHRSNNNILHNPLQAYLNLSMNFRRTQVTSNNQLRSPTINTNGSIDLFIRSSVGSWRQSFNNQVTCEEALRQISEQRHMDATNLELIYFCHFSSRQFTYLADFIQDVPSRGSVNLMERNNKWSDSTYDARLCVISFPPQPIVLSSSDTESNSGDSGIDGVNTNE